MATVSPAPSEGDAALLAQLSRVVEQALRCNEQPPGDDKAARENPEDDGEPAAQETAAAAQGDAQRELLERALALAALAARELAGERESLRLAAQAGSELLERLAAAQDEAEAARAAGERAALENARLRAQAAALELEVRRRSLALELQLQAAQQRETELLSELERAQLQLQQRGDDCAAAAAAAEELELRLSQLRDELARAESGREALRASALRLRSDRDVAAARLREREDSVAQLERELQSAATRAQIAANRLVRAERERDALAATAAALEQRLQLESPPSGAAPADAGLARANRDLEALLDESQAQVDALARENRQLRRESPAKAASVPKSAHRRSGGNWAAAVSTHATTAAEALGEASFEPPQPNEATEAATAAIVSEVKSKSSGPKRGVRRRHLELALPWVAALQSPSDQDQANVGLDLTPLPSDHDTQRVSLVSRLNGVDISNNISRPDDGNVVGTKALDKGKVVGDAKDADGESAGRQSSHPTVDELKRAEAEPGSPKSPMYVGLSLLACATAASMLARR